TLHKLCIPARTCGHTFSVTTCLSFGTNTTAPTTIATTITASRISASSPLPPISSRSSDCPITRAVTMNSTNWATVPDKPHNTPDDVATATPVPCFCRKRMFINVEAAPVGSTMLVNDTAYCIRTAGPSGILSSTEPIVVNAYATCADCVNSATTTTHAQSAVLSVSNSSLT